MRQVEEALARQVIYGGDLVTNLLEVAPIDEAQLAPVIAESLGLDAAPAGELPVGAERHQLVPTDLALKAQVVPLALTQQKLVLAVIERLSHDVESQLASSLGVSVEQRAAPAVRVRQALSRLYGVPLDRRMQRLVARLSGLPTPMPSSRSVLAAAAPAAVAAPAPVAAPPDLPPQRPRIGTPPLGSPIAVMRSMTPSPVAHRVPRTTSKSFPAALPPAYVPASGSSAAAVRSAAAYDSVPPPTPVLPEHRAGLLQRDVPTVMRAARRRRGPITLEAAKREADEASDRDGLLHLFFDFSRQFFEYAALFLLHGDIAEGFDAFGTGASRERVVGIGVPLDLPSLLASARDDRAAVVARPPSDGLDAVLLADLQRPRDAELAVVPLVVRTRAVAILIGDCGDAGIDRAGMDQVVAAAAMVGKALERIIVRRKLEGFIAGGRAAEAPAARGEADEAATDFSAGQGAPPSSSPPFGAARPARASLAMMASASSMPPPPANVAAVRRISGPPIPREEPDSGPGRAEPPAAALHDPAAEDPGGPTEAPDAGRPDAPDAAEGPEVQVVVESDARDEAAISGDLDARTLFDMLGWETGAEGPEAAPPSSAFAVPPHRPPAGRTASSPELPSVIVDLQEELSMLVERVASGEADESAEAELLRQGDQAMRVITSRFPGPVTFDRARLVSTPNPPRASDCGPLLRLVARERKVALPFVLNWMADQDPEIRGWATHLVCELPYAEAIPHVIERLRDPDAGTRASALLAIAAIAKTAPDGVRDALQELGASRDPACRAAAVRAIASLRQGALVPQVLGVLADVDERVVSAAHDALVRLTAQDFGSDARPWMKWWEQNAARHRIEWLIDALTHDAAEIRRAAGEELRALTREYFGYAPDLPPRDRDRAQQRYRDWWMTEGRTRFRRR